MSRILWLSSDRGVDPAKPKGATANLLNLARAFRELGHELLVLTPNAFTEDELGVPVRRIDTPVTLRELLDEVEPDGPRFKGSPTRELSKERRLERRRVVRACAHLWNQVAVEDALDRTIPRFQPDLVFERYSRFGVAGAATAARHGVRHVLNVHASLAWEGGEYRQQALQEAADVLEAMTFERAQRIVVNSDELRAQLEQSGVAPERLRVVMNGVHLDELSPEGDRAPLNVPDDSVVLGFVGSLKGWHGMDVLCEAFRLLAGDERVHLLVVGDGPERDRVSELAASLPGRVTTTGAVPLADVPAWWRAIDVAVAPYPPLERFYYSPLKVLEAMATGRPTVASRIGQVTDMVEHERTGLLVPPGDVSELAAALKRLVDDADLRAALGAEARRVAVERHSWNARAAEMIEFGLDQPTPSGEGAATR